MQIPTRSLKPHIEENSLRCLAKECPEVPLKGSCGNPADRGKSGQIECALGRGTHRVERATDTSRHASAVCGAAAPFVQHAKHLVRKPYPIEAVVLWIAMALFG